MFGFSAADWIFSIFILVVIYISVLLSAFIQRKKRGGAMPGINRADMKELFDNVRVIAVVGLSDDPSRPSHEVASYLKLNGYRIIPVNPAKKEMLGEKCYSSLLEIPEQVDLIDVFRRPENAPQIAEEAIETGARYLWFQEGVIHQGAAEKAASCGMEVIMDRCILKEHMKLKS